MDSNNCFGILIDQRGQFGGFQVESPGINIAKNDFCPLVLHYIGCCHPRESRNNYFIPGSYIQCCQRKMKSRGSACYGYRMIDFMPLSKC